MEQTPQGDASTPTPTSPLSIKTPAVPESLTTVTPLSKALATALFILLPFMGFLFGVQYQSTSVQTVLPILPTPIAPTPLPLEPAPGASQPGGDTTLPTPSNPNPGAPSPVDIDDTPMPPVAGAGECAITNCHGLDISCGITSEPLACTMMYQIGDGCRQFASCGVVDGQCAPLPSARFSACKSCVEKCLELPDDDPSARLSCESTCMQ
jgi:hypothetical protein